jgi:hypothetical protein
MEQRPLRLGDIVDDYCPRERRLTNHAIVAIVENEVRQTRCTTCDAEHIYKHGREPRRRKKDDSLFDQVLADLAGGQLVSAKPTASETDDGGPVEEPGASSGSADAPAEQAASEAESEENEAAADAPHEDAWPAHRRLIRASLPRVEGEPPAPRPIPEFTMHQRPQGRGFHPHRFGGGGSGGGERNGNVAYPRGDGRSGGGHQGNGAGNRHQQDGQRHRSGRRRGRHKHSR